tara:strand:+ start:87194 stop:88129 length:936 start_codon:yes stop_codon:yes gene_type:complete
MGFSYAEWEDISVIVPAYNSENTILRALHSIAKQTVKVREVIIVDDGSTDNTLNIVNKEATLEGWVLPIHVFQQKNTGPAAARNHAIKHAKGEYLAFLDADDEWHPTKVARSIEEMKKHKCTLIAHDLIHQYKMGRKYYIESSLNYEKERVGCHARLFLNNYINTSTVLVRKDAVVEAGGFDQTSLHDVGYDLWQSILSNPKNTFYVFKSALVTYHITNHSLSSNILQRLRQHERFIVRHATHAAKGTFLPFPLLVISKTYNFNMGISGRAIKSNMFGGYFITIIRMPYSILKTLLLSIVMPRFKRINYLK